MTTNSPNQFDGDVQALIEHIKKWKESSTFFESVVEFNKRQSQIYEIALAALMAEPGIFEWRFKETDCAPATGWIAVPMERLEQAKQTFGDLVEYRFWFPTPPAQLLRPVELPTGCTSGYSSLGCDEIFIRKSELISALRQQGYEVKS